MVAERTGIPPHSQVKLSGIIPPLADSFHQRPETGLDLRAGLYPGDTVVLTHGEDTDATPAAQGGTGKTQLAVAFTHALWGAREVDALVWVSATSREAIITGFAQAAVTVGAAEAALSAETAADRFIGWLARTRRPWALILDDLVSLADLENLWPAGLAGQVVITTRLPETVFRGGPSPAPSAAAGPRIAPVGGFSRREVLAYLSTRLTDYPDQRGDYPDQRGDALDLGEDLGGLPLGLAQAAAVMTVDRLSCREYRGRFGERREHMSAMRIDGVSPAVLATWSLAAECAHQLPPAGVAWPALALAAMLDPDGIPGAVLTSPAGCGYIAGRPSSGEAADQTLVHAAMTNLARVGLVSVDPASPIRTVRMHASVQAAVRAYLPPADFEQAVLAAAEALMQTWPEAGGGTQDPLEQAELEQVLRDCTGALWAADSAVPRPAEGGQHARPQAPAGAPPGGQAYQVTQDPPEQAVAAGSPPGAVPQGDEPGDERAGRIRYQLLADHAHHQHQAARQRARQRSRGPGPAGRRLRVGRALRRRHRGVHQRAGRPGAQLRTRTPRYDRGARTARPRLLQRRAASRGDRAVRADGGRRRSPARSRAPGHAGRAGQPGGRVPGSRPGQGSADRLPDAHDRFGKAPRRAPPEYAGNPGKPGRRLPGRRAAQGCHRALQAAGRGHRSGGRLRSSRRDRGTDQPRVGLWSAAGS